MKVFVSAKLILIILILFSSCTNSENADHKINFIDVGSQVGSYKESFLSAYTNDIKYIPLSNENENFIKHIVSIDFFEDKILISDMKKCLLFNTEGKIKVKIGNIGNGPGEHVIIEDCKIPNEKYIYIHAHNHIKCYNHKGDFIIQYLLKEQDEDIGSWQFINDTTIIAKIPNYTGKSKYCARIFSLSGKTLKRQNNYIFFNRKEDYVTDKDSKASIYFSCNNLYFKEMLNDTIFHVSPDFKFSPAHIIDLGKYKMREDYNELEFKEHMWTTDYIFINDVYETEGYLFLDIFMGKHSLAPHVLGIYSKSINSFYLVKPDINLETFMPTGIKNDIDNGPDFYPKAKINDSTLVTWIDSYKLKEYVSTDVFKNSIPKYPEKKRELAELANSLSKNDNPVLMIVKLKD